MSRRGALGYANASVIDDTGIDGSYAKVAGEMHIFENPVKAGVTPALCSKVPEAGFKKIVYPGASGTSAVGQANPGPASICMECWQEAGWRP